MPFDLNTLSGQFLIGSTLVEGSTLSEREAEEVLAGRTVQGHSITEVRELLNYRAAVEWFLGEVAASPYVSSNLILDLHTQLFRGVEGDAGRWKSATNYTFRSDGTRLTYADPRQVPARISNWLEMLNGEARGDIDERAASLYYEFQIIHPFADGNGRIGRLLIAYWLHWKHGAPFSFYASDKLAHLDALEAANDRDLEPLAAFVRMARERAE